MSVTPPRRHTAERRSSGRAPRWPGHWGWLWGLLLSGVLAEGLALTEAAIEQVERRYGSEARERVVRLGALLRRHAADPDPTKLARVNDFFNAVPYATDQQLWRQDDYWATPVETLGVHGADCEDYAIAKYFALRELGVPAARLRITYVKALTLDQAHMVLAYYATPAAEPLILDNLEQRILSAAERDDLLPVYSFNGDDLWLAVSRSGGRKVGGAERIGLWNKLRAKMAQEGQP